MLVTLWQLWGRFVITFGILGRRWGPLWKHLRHMGVTLGALQGHFWVTFGSYRRRMAGVMHVGAGLVGLKSESMHATRATSKF